MNKALHCSVMEAFVFFFVSADQHKGGIVAETDELLPEVEKTLLQTERTNSLLR